MTVGRTIKNTEHVSAHDWPDEVMVQGGAHGAVIVRDGDNYTTAFVEAFPAGTFLRGEGPTIGEADAKCWAQYERWTSCEHGPYEPRHYENGSGYCVKCGMWASQVCEPSERVKIENLACERVIAQYGQHVPIMPQWQGLVADEAARIRAALDFKSEPPPTTTPPTPAEYAEATRIFREPDVANAAIDELLSGLAERGDASP